jgi:hypothetical protein
MKNCFPLFTSSIMQGALVGAAGSLWPIEALEYVGLYFNAAEAQIPNNPPSSWQIGVVPSMELAVSLPAICTLHTQTLEYQTELMLVRKSSSSSW